MIIQMENIHKRFGRHNALKGLSMSVPEGSAFALIGANGAGKSTAIKTLLNILEPSSGSVSVLGVESSKLSPREFAVIGYVAESQDMPKRLTVGQYLNYLRPFYPTWDRELEADILNQFRLPLDRKIGELSHGMRLKASLACALPYRPKLLVLDEPFTGLDPLMRDEFIESLIAQAGDMTILISSHELAEIESLVTHVGFLDQGRLLFQEPMEGLNGRFREVRVTLEHEAPISIDAPSEWIQVRVVGKVLSFVDTRFDERSFSARIAAMFQHVRGVDTQPIPLRSIFTTLARAAQNEGAKK